MSATHFNVINPATEAVIGQCPLNTEETLNQAVSKANQAFNTWSQTDPAERKALLTKAAALIDENIDELSELLTQEQGGPLAATKNEIGFAAKMAGIFSTFDNEQQEQLNGPENRITILRKPLGVIGVITPWNAPVLLAMGKVVSALLTGNTAIVKPASYTPLTTIKIVDLFNQVLPEGVLQVLTGNGRFGDLITRHPGIHKISFTGSTPVGKKIMAACAETVKRVTLELGGNDAAIVLDDADPALLAENIFWGAFKNNGQVCAAIKRLYVHEDVYESFCEHLAEVANSVNVGNGLDAGTQLGPIQNKAQYETIIDLLNDAKSSGARILTGGEISEGPGYFIHPTLVADIEDGSRLVDEEQFGPLLPIIKFSDEEDALQRANNSPYGLGGSVWSGSEERAKALAARLEVGTAWVNQHTKLNPKAPFGGWKESGLGVEFSKYGLEEYTSFQVLNIEGPA